MSASLLTLVLLVSNPLPTVANALFCTMIGANDELFISLPGQAEVRKLDLTTGQLLPWAVGLLTPYYGQFGADGNLYMGDSGLGAIWRVEPNGHATIVTAGGLVVDPLSVTVHPVTGKLIVTEAFYQNVLLVDPVTGEQSIFCDNSLGLFMVPGGVDFDLDGNLFMTDHGTHDIIKMDPSGNPTLILDGPSNGIKIPAGIEVDGAGNIFASSFGNNEVLRIRADTGEWEVFCDDPILQNPNDITVAADGTLIVSSAGTTSVTKIDALGNATVLAQDGSFGPWVGVARLGSEPGCNGRMIQYGTGTSGEGAIVPRLQGIFSPCAGTEVGYVIDHGSGGKTGVLLFGLGAGDLHIWGGSILIDFTKWWRLAPFHLDGSGPGNGRARFRFLHPDDPNLAGISFYLQALILDDTNSYGIAMTQGLQVLFGQ